MWPIDCTKDTIKNRGSTVNIWRIKLSISSIFRSVKTSCLCKIPSAKKNIFLLQKFSVFSFSSYIFFFSEYFPPFPSPIFLLRSSSRYQNIKMSKFQCPHSISRTCLAQEFGLVNCPGQLNRWSDRLEWLQWLFMTKETVPIFMIVDLHYQSAHRKIAWLRIKKYWDTPGNVSKYRRKNLII